MVCRADNGDIGYTCTLHSFEVGGACLRDRYRFSVWRAGLVLVSENRCSSAVSISHTQKGPRDASEAVLAGGLLRARPSAFGLGRIFSPCPRRSLLPPSAGQRTAGRQVGRSVIKIMPPKFWILAQIITDSLLSLLLLFMGIIASYYWGDNVLLLSQVECRQGIQAHSAPRPLELFGPPSRSLRMQHGAAPQGPR